MSTLFIQIAIAAALFLGGLASGVKIHAGITAQRDLKAVQESARTQILRVDKADRAADQHEKTKTKIETRFVEVEKEVVRVIQADPVYVRQCLTDDGLRVLSAAINGDNAASKPAPAVSGPAITR